MNRQKKTSPPEVKVKPTPPPVPPKPPAAESQVPPLLMPGGLSRELIRVMLLGFALVFAFRFGHHVVEVLLMFAMVFLMAIILNAPVTAIQRHGVKRGAAVTLVMVSLIAIISGAGWIVVPTALEQANSLVSKAPHYWMAIQTRAHELETQYPALHNLLPQPKQGKSGEAEKTAANAPNNAFDPGNNSSETQEPSPATANSAADATSDAPAQQKTVAKANSPFESFVSQDALLGYAKRALAFTTSVLGDLFVLVLSLLLLVFTLANPQALVSGLLCSVHDDYRESARRALARIFMQMPGWARAVCINGTITAIFTGVGLALVGVQPALVLGICAFWGEFVPTIGPMVAAAPALFVALSIGTPTFFKALGVIVLVQAVISNAINPIIMGREMKLHPASILFFALTMGKIFGIAGAILAVPTAATAKILFEEFYLFRRGIPECEIQKLARGIVMGESGVAEPDI